MKIAIVHDYFTQLGGAEKVAEKLARIFPGCTLHSTVLYHRGLLRGAKRPLGIEAAQASRRLPEDRAASLCGNG